MIGVVIVDNVVFNVNGREPEDLQSAIKLAMDIVGYKTWAWSIDNTKGLMLYWYKTEGTTECIAPLDAEETFNLAMTFLKSDKAKDIECNDWDKNLSLDGYFDGSTSLGWRVYTEDWGPCE